MSFTTLSLLGAALSAAWLLHAATRRLRLGTGAALTAALAVGVLARGALARSEGVDVEALEALLPGLTPILAAPLIFLAGAAGGIGRVHGASFAREAATELLRLAVTVFFTGAILTAFLAWPTISYADERREIAFLLALALAVPALSGPSAGDASVSSGGRTSSSLFLAFLVSAIGLSAASEPIRPLSESILRLLIGSAAAGLAGAALEQCVLAAVSPLQGSHRQATRAAAAIAAASMTVLTGGSPLAAALLAGLASGFLERWPRSSQRLRGEIVQDHTATRAWTAFSATSIAAAIGFFHPWVFQLATWPRALGIAVLVLISQALLQSGLSLIRPATRPQRPIREALAGALRSQPGALTVVLVASFELLERGFLSLDDASAVASVGCVQQVLVLLWMSQGIGRRFDPAYRESEVFRRWRDRQAYSRALSACERRLDELLEDSTLSPDAAVVFRRALERSRGLQGLVAGDSAEASARLEQERWTESLRALLFEARRAVRQACEEGNLSESVALELERELLRRWHEADELSVEEAFRHPLDDTAG